MMPASEVSKSATAVSDEPGLLSIQSAIFEQMPVVLKAHMGEAALSIAELLALKPGSVVGLETKLSDQIELRVNGALLARGEIVAVDDKFGVRIAHIFAPS